MLKKINRLRKKSEIDKVYKKGIKSFGEFSCVRLLKNNQKEDRFAIVISNKIEKSAVKRNRIRRLFREVIKKYISNNNSIFGFDFIININSYPTENTVFYFEKEFNKCLKKLF